MAKIGIIINLQCIYLDVNLFILIDGVFHEYSLSIDLGNWHSLRWYNLSIVQKSTSLLITQNLVQGHAECRLN